ncbi:hypothetical protein FGG08_006752 [Glutinoglossum americanum]|uniref:Uncharacterized protein n=1 Tax=Glutinoglossum americanum TaxID=1670608 RepID=A0A9P8I0N3_9PEZI|nr:hypothetical protein FGG08_006752 [Glutinoglossum americanum]
MLKEIGIHKKDRVDSIRSKKALSKVLSSPDATRTLYSLTLQSKPGSQLQKHPNLLVETISNYQIIHIEAYVVYVDLVQSKELAFKSTPESISGLAKYRRHIHLVDARNGRSEEAEKLQHEFIDDEVKNGVSQQQLIPVALRMGSTAATNSSDLLKLAPLQVLVVG